MLGTDSGAANRPSRRHLVEGQLRKNQHRKRAAWPAPYVAFWVLVLLSLVSCRPPNEEHLENWPTVSEEQSGLRLSVDGSWLLYSPGYYAANWPTQEQLPILVKNGHIYLPEGYIIRQTDGGGLTMRFITHVFPPNSVVAKNLQQTGPRTFECDWATLKYHAERPPNSPEKQIDEPLVDFAPATIQIATNRSLMVSVLGGSGVDSVLLGGGVDKVLVRATLSSSPEDGKLAEVLTDEKSIETTLATEIEYRLVRTDEYEIPRGASIRVSFKEETESEVAVSVDTALGGGLSLDVLGWLEVEVRRDVQRKRSESRRELKTGERELILKGDIATRYIVSWYDRIQKGTVRFHLEESGSGELPFEIKEGMLVKALPIVSVSSAGEGESALDNREANPPTGTDG